MLAPGAWPRLKSLSLPAAARFTADANARDALASLFLACGPGLQTLDLNSWNCYAKPHSLTETLAVLGDEVRKCTNQKIAVEVSVVLRRQYSPPPCPKQTVPIPWRASLDTLCLPIQSGHFGTEHRMCLARQGHQGRQVLVQCGWCLFASNH